MKTLLFLLLLVTFSVPALAQNAELDKMSADRANLINQLEKSKCGLQTYACSDPKQQPEHDALIEKSGALTIEYLAKHKDFVNSLIPQDSSVESLTKFDNTLETNYKKQQELLKTMSCPPIMFNWKQKSDCFKQQGILDNFAAAWTETRALKESAEYAKLPLTTRIADSIKIWAFRLVAVVGMLILPAFFIYRIFFKKRPIPVFDSHGSARFLEVDELETEGFFFNEGDDDELLYLNHVNRKKTKKIQENPILGISGEILKRHAALVGGTGAGKSRKIIMPNIVFSANKISIFVTDPSGEIASQTSGYWKYKQFFSPAGNSPNKFNFIPLCEDSITSDLLARSLVELSSGKSDKSKVWNQFAIEIVSAIFSHLAESATPYPHLAYDLVNSAKLIGVLKSSNSAQARTVGESLEGDSENLLGNKMSGAKSALDFLKHKTIRQFCYSDEVIDFAKILREKPTVCYWIVPKTDAEVYKPLTALAFQIQMRQLTQHPDKELTVRLVLDEFDDLGTVTDFAKRVKDVRKDNISILIGIQDFAQLEENYGKNGAEIIFSSLKTKICLTANEGSTAERISKALGKTTVAREVVSQMKSNPLDFQPNITRSIQENQRDLQTPDEIRRLPEDKAIIISTDKYPFIAPVDYFNNEDAADVSALLTKPATEALPTLFGAPVEKTQVQQTPETPKMPEMPELPNLVDFNLPEEDREMPKMEDFDLTEDDRKDLLEGTPYYRPRPGAETKSDPPKNDDDDFPEYIDYK